MDRIPNDPHMLCSFANLKLRDQFDSLEAFCAEYGLDADALAEKLAAAGYEYIRDINQFR